MMRPTAAAAPLIATWILLGLAADPATAATIVVDRVDDEPDAVLCEPAVPMDCSLRGAILRGNFLPGPDTVQLPSGVYELDPLLGTLEVTDELVIEGLEGERPLIRAPANGWGDERLLETPIIPPAPLTVRRLILEGGRYQQFDGGTIWADYLTLEDAEVRRGVAQSGGCVGAGGELTIRRSVIRDCVVTDEEDDSYVSGGCVISQGDTLIEGSTISGCSREVAPNRFDGGALYVHGGLLLRDSLVLGDAQAGSIFGLGGAIYVHPASGAPILIERSAVVSGDATRGGVIYVGFVNSLVVRDSVIRGGTAVDGGGIYAQETQLLLERSSISHNHASGNGGGIWADWPDMIVTNSTLSSNSARHGSALDLHLDGSALLIQSTLVEHPSALSLLRGEGIVVVASALAGTCVDPLTSSGDNFESPGNTCALDAPTDHPSTPDLGLADLAFHATLEGAGSYAHLPLVGSPLLNAVAGACAVDHDQLGQPRPLTPFDPACDAGAIEGTGSPGIFIDGFESGSTWRWSTTVQ